MNTIVEKITEQLQNAFAECGYDRKYAKVSLSNRPDLCEYQCNGAMAAAKEYKKAPFMIADEVVAKLDKNPLFDRIESVKPGFINIILSGQAVADYVMKWHRQSSLVMKILKSQRWSSWITAEPMRQNRFT